MLDLLSSLIESSHVAIPLSGSKTPSSNPSKNCHVNKNIAGWEQHVAPFKNDAVFWHGIWKSAGCPNSGVLRDVMARTKNKYHYAIRRVKLNADQISRHRPYPHF